MNVKYFEQTFYFYPSVKGGTGKDWSQFLSNIVGWLMSVGAPFNPDSVDTGDYNTSTTAAGRANVYMNFIGEPLYENDEEYIDIGYLPAGFNMSVNPPTEDTSHVEFDFWAYGRSDPYANGPGSYVSDWIDLGAKTNGYFAVTGRAIKSGDSFYFGFKSVNSPSQFNVMRNGAFMNFAITPMRRLSNPSAEDLGYAAVKAPVLFWEGMVPFAFYNATLPLMIGRNLYPHGDLSYYIITPHIGSYPEIESGKIPLVPIFAGFEDIYYENIYFTPMRSDGIEEKAFETDKGIFLIGNSIEYDYNDALVNHMDWPYCQLAFDITEAVNNS